MNTIDISKTYKLVTTKTINNEISGLYCGDLLSFVMSHAEAGNLLLTITNNLNTIAVAVLLELSGVIFCENVTPTMEMIEKAETENIALFVTDKTKVEIIKELI